MTSAKIQVTVLVDSATPWCEGECTLDWSKTEHQNLARKEVNKRHGDEVKLEFLDIRAPAKKLRHEALIRQAQGEKLPLPVLMLNGNPRIAGPFDIRMLLDVIEAERDREL